MIEDHKKKLEYINYQHISVQNLTRKKLHVQYTSETYRPVSDT